MKVILYNAISIDGFIALPDGNSDWVSEKDTPYFEEAISESGCIVVGGKTFRQFEGQSFPVKNALNIVMTKSNKINSKYENVIFTDSSPSEIINMANEKNFKSLLLVGGGELNGSFLNEDLIDEIIVDIHPIMLGTGIKVANALPALRNFEKVSLKELENGLVLVKYSRRRN